MSKVNILISIALFTMLICLLDFFTRLSIAEGGVLIEGDESVVMEKEIAFLADEKNSEIQKLLQAFDIVEQPKVVEAKVDKIKKPKINIMASEEQLKQNGDLAGLFDGEDKYTLTATFFDSKRKFALLTKKHLLSGHTSQFRLYEGEKLSEYLLKRVNNDYIEFTQANRNIKLKLFTTNKEV